MTYLLQNLQTVYENTAQYLRAETTTSVESSVFCIKSTSRHNLITNIGKWYKIEFDNKMLSFYFVMLHTLLQLFI